MKKKPSVGRSEQSVIDPQLTIDLIEASAAAYADFGRKTVTPPSNYKWVARWTGWDGSILGGVEERYGLVFQSVEPEQAKTFIFAFRGTDTDMDIYEDLFFETTAFKSTKGAVSPAPRVSAGFYDIYDTRGGSMKRSMREQVFAFLAKYKPNRIYITGHSLGGALAQLFSLDVAVSAPDIWAANINFASPMVGVASWKSAYEAQPAEHDPARQTVRVYNYWDYVPSLPPSFLDGYAHVGRGFRTAFYVQGEWYPHIVARHSILNLQTVLRHAVWRKPQVWAGIFPDAKDPRRHMCSVSPPAGVTKRWPDRSIETLEREQRPLTDSTTIAATRI